MKWSAVMQWIQIHFLLHPPISPVIISRNADDELWPHWSGQLQRLMVYWAVDRLWVKRLWWFSCSTPALHTEALLFTMKGYIQTSTVYLHSLFMNPTSNQTTVTDWAVDQKTAVTISSPLFIHFNFFPLTFHWCLIFGRKYPHKLLILPIVEIH